MGNIKQSGKNHRGEGSYKRNYHQNREEEIRKIPLTRLKPFEAQPFKVLMDDSMTELVESIRERGVLSPIIARPYKDGGFEILSGHRRAKACEIAGIKNVPVIVKNLDDDSAAILLVDSNLQRENILPSEKAYAYRLKLEAMKRQGKRSDLTLSQVGTKLRSDEELAKQTGESRNQIQRYIRLTELIDPLLDLVDEKKLPLNAAVELSYLGSKAQSEVVRSIEKNELSPSIEQSAEIRKMAQDGHINQSAIDEVMQTPKPEKMRIVFKEDKLRRYFPADFTAKQIEDTIVGLIENWAKSRADKTVENTKLQKHRNDEFER